MTHMVHRRGPLGSSFRGNDKAFTLIEMSMVLIVIGLVILIVFPALTAMRTSGQRALTNSNLQALLRATAVYAQANGCLPCPTPANTTDMGFGRVRGDTNSAVCGSCARAEGLPPFVSLGLPAATARDGWGHWITMRVDPALTVNFGVVPPTSPCLSSDPQPCTLNMSQKGLCRAALSATNRITVQTPGGSSQQAAVILVSHGANGYGAFLGGAAANGLNGSRLPFPVNAPLCASGGYEMCNADGTTDFADAAVLSGGSNPYDDTLLFLDRNNLVSYLGNSSCQTAW